MHPFLRKTPLQYAIWLLHWYNLELCSQLHTTYNISQNGWKWRPYLRRFWVNIYFTIQGFQVWDWWRWWWGEQECIGKMVSKDMRVCFYSYLICSCQMKYQWTQHFCSRSSSSKTASWSSPSSEPSRPGSGGPCSTSRSRWSGPDRGHHCK